jgi:glycosyltransferase involved in cell wall biosynthesis
VLVLDNASTDTTPSVARGMEDRFASLRYLFEGQLGLSRARNTALAEASAPYIAFLDDDAVASPHWLETLLAAFETAQPAPGCVAGRIDPIWEGPRPAWLADGLLPYLAVVNWSEGPMTLDPSCQYAAGANMAFLTSALRDVGGFNPGLGRVGTWLLSGEELHVQRLLSAAGYQLYYEPRASVGHHVPPSRLTREWFMRRAYAEGVSGAVLQTVMERLSRGGRTVRALQSLMDLFLSPRQWAGSFLSAAEPVRFQRRCQTIRHLGMIWGLLAYSEVTT